MAKKMIPKIFFAFGMFMVLIWSMLIGVSISQHEMQSGHILVLVSTVGLFFLIVLIFYWGTKWIQLAAEEDHPPLREHPTIHADWWKKGDDGYASFLASNRWLFDLSDEEP